MSDLPTLSDRVAMLEKKLAALERGKAEQGEKGEQPHVPDAISERARVAWDNLRMVNWQGHKEAFEVGYRAAATWTPPPVASPADLEGKARETAERDEQGLYEARTEELAEAALACIKGAHPDDRKNQNRLRENLAGAYSRWDAAKQARHNATLRKPPAPGDEAEKMARETAEALVDEWVSHVPLHPFLHEKKHLERLKADAGRALLAFARDAIAESERKVREAERERDDARATSEAYRTALCGQPGVSLDPVRVVAEMRARLAKAESRAESAEARAGEWRDASREKPPLFTNVLVGSPFGGVTMGRFSPTLQIVTAGGWGVPDASKYTHWKPLDLPPSQND